MIIWKQGSKKSEWKAGKVLKATSKLEDSPTGREIYENVGECNTVALPYCSHWWWANQNCFECVANVFSQYMKCIQHLNSFPKVKLPQANSFVVLQNAVKNLLIVAKFKFVEYSEKLNFCLLSFE